MLDLHNHTSFSPDGKIELCEMVQKARDMGITVFGTTEHWDYDYVMANITVQKTDIPAYVRAATEMKQSMNGEGFTYLLGAECGYHKDACAYYTRKIAEHSFDYIINSTHVTDGKDCYFQEYFRGKSRETAYKRYFETVLESLSAPYPWHILGHLGYVSRNAPYENPRITYEEYKGYYDEILTTLIAKEKTLEVNTNVKTCGYLILPHGEILKRYFALGGRRVSFGSDAHRADSMLQSYELVIGLLKSIGFNSLTYYVNGEERQFPI
ncbi:MAG: histidinol-phosphatase HisJ family protein [Clostridia bacterium]|nr:histidinol-phosphatase HisJ family protein [Clostridia bacterium]